LVSLLPAPTRRIVFSDLHGDEIRKNVILLWASRTAFHMARKESIKEDGRVWHIEMRSIRVDYLDGDYSLRWRSKQTVGETGGWELFTIKHVAGYPMFKGRWDEKDTAVDVDLLETSSANRSKNSKVTRRAGKLTNSLLSPNIRRVKASSRGDQPASY
jgi:hypothetical protein